MNSGKTNSSILLILVCIFIALLGAGSILLVKYNDNRSIKPPSPPLSGDSDKDGNGCYTPDTVRNHYGENACVDFTVGYTYETSAGTKFIDEKEDYTSGFVGYIAYDSPANTLDVDALDGKNIKITGTIRNYDDYPEIVITSTDQVEVYN